MKRTLAIAAVFFAAGCARPVYVIKSDAESAAMRSTPAQVRETVFDNLGDADVLPDTLGLFDVYTEIVYNRAGNIVSHNSFRGKDSLHFVREEFFYTPSGERMVRSESHNLVKNSVRVLEYSYDAQGNLVSESEKTGTYSTDFRYDRRGYLKKEINTVSDEESGSVTRYRYGRGGQLKTVKGGGVYKTYSYHPDGTVAGIRTGDDVEELYDTNGNLVSITHIVTSRDENDRVRDRFPVSITAEYEYDARGNWTRRTQFYEGRVQGVAVREIDYFGESGTDGTGKDTVDNVAK